MSKKKLLVHTCCAPCLVAVFDYICANLNEFGLNTVEDFDCIWYNNNIHPRVEYERRKDTLAEYLLSVGKQGVFLDEYDMKTFVHNATHLEELGYSMRCEMCYTTRLEKVFEYARDNGYLAVTTTLLISPYQKHDVIIKVATELSKKYGVEFKYKDFRPYFREGQAKAKELGLYRQKFCGCIYSIDEGGKITIN